MGQQPKTVLDQVTTAIRIAVKLVGQFNAADRADAARTAVLFVRLQQLVRGLPPNRHLNPKFAENMGDWPRVWEMGEYKAARYQMVQLIRKLRNYRDDWGSGGVPAASQPRSPIPAASAAEKQGEVA